MLDKFSVPELRLLLDGIGAPVFMVDIQPGERYVYLCGNKTFERFTGFGLDQFAGFTVEEMISTQDAHTMKSQYRQCIESRQAVQFEAPIQVPVGRRWWRIVLNPVFGEQGEVARILGTATDITEARRADETLRYQHLLLSTEREMMPDGILVADPNRHILSWNTRLKRMWGLTEEMRSKGREVSFPHVLAQLVEPHAFERQVDELYADLCKEVRGAELQLKDGRIIEWYSRGLIDEAGVGRGRIWFFRDITERKQIEKELLETQALQQAVLDSTSQAILSVDREINLRSFNRAAERLLGYKAEEVVGRVKPYIFHDAQEVEERRRALSQALGREVNVYELFHGTLREGERSAQKWHYVHKDGHKIPVELTLTPLMDTQGDHAGYVAVVTDISEREAYEQRLKELASTDGLTGLWNRRHFLALMEPTLHHARRYGEPLMVLLLDIDRFKRINDTFGHDAGDAVLKAVADVLAKTLRHSDLLCRWGGEEFAAVLVNTPPGTALEVAERLRAAVEMLEVTQDGVRIPLSTSVGLSDWDSSEPNLDNAMQRADRSLYQAKEEGRNLVRSRWTREGLPAH